MNVPSRSPLHPFAPPFICTVYHNPPYTVETPFYGIRARRRFSESPPSSTSTSHLSPNATRSQSPNPLDDEQQQRDEQNDQLGRDHLASLPRNQSDAQSNEERRQIFEADRNGTCREPAGTDFYELGEENIKKRWVEQGIWNPKWNRPESWNGRPEGRWKHEEPPELESEYETDSQAEEPPFRFPGPRAPKPKRPKSNANMQLIAERRTVREREREASRPFYQL
ncbi:Uu.00g063600.m01.CDS01 [Anthostomella pinea]|uniref:Uu.00g063600.m01.CDS01 n=1 Tax=Anthostomella pinea TaxID=933095 RepID=A0AAI8VU08_9PEZI|nr:Uu.00g063600.m01.CDS01 [Anthostomella pinea]